MNKEELREYLAELSQPTFRAGQLFYWLQRGAPLCEMTNIPKALREKLPEPDYPRIERKLVSRLDGTVKYLFRLADDELVESVVMRYEHGLSICVSSEAGCAMGCKFCASTLRGLSRRLSAGEILGQVIIASRDMNERIDSVVLMGIGEPLDNYDNVIRFIELASEPDGLGISRRSFSLSTCGLVDGIYRLADEGIPLTLSISLHACSDAERSELMPINRRYKLDELLTACRSYFDRTGRRISFEYTVIPGVNDSREQAKRLAGLLNRYMKGAPYHVNLIPLNPVSEREFQAGTRQGASEFARHLGEQRVNATVRRTLGADINASCGQLRARGLDEAARGSAPET